MKPSVVFDIKKHTTNRRQHKILPKLIDIYQPLVRDNYAMRECVWYLNNWHFLSTQTAIMYATLYKRQKATK